VGRIGPAGGSRFPDKGCQDGGGQRQQGATDPGQPESAHVQQLVPKQRPERDAKVERQRVEAERLPGSALRCQIGQRRERGHEEDGLPHAEHQAQAQEHPQLGREGVRHQGQCAQQGAANDERAPPAAVRSAPGERAQGHRRHAEGADGDSHPQLVGAERSLGEERRQRNGQARCREVGQLAECQQDEGRREEAFALVTLCDGRGIRCAHRAIFAAGSRRQLLPVA
jgi:hypothetical protein